MSETVCLLLIAIGLLCGALFVCGWIADRFSDALTVEHLNELEKRQ